MKNSDLLEILAFIQDVAYEAGEIILKHQKMRKHLVVIDKGHGQGIASSADKDSEDFIIQAIQTKFPSHSILAEEQHYQTYDFNPDTWRDLDHLWIIDPLDGTNNFVNGIPIFAISIALICKGRTVLGLVYNPHSGECFFATDGQGSFLIDYRINPLKKFHLEIQENHKEMAECIFSPAPNYEGDHRFESQLSVFKKNIIGARAVRRLGSAALELCYVACGNFDGYWEKNLRPWDVAAAFLVCKESGVKVTDFSGVEYSPFNDSIIAAADPIHARILGHL